MRAAFRRTKSLSANASLIKQSVQASHFVPSDFFLFVFFCFFKIYVSVEMPSEGACQIADCRDRNHAETLMHQSFGRGLGWAWPGSWSRSEAGGVVSILIPRKT